MDQLRRILGEAPRRRPRPSAIEVAKRQGVKGVIRAGAIIAGTIAGRVISGVGGVLWPTPTADSTVPGFEEERRERLEALRRSQTMEQGPPENFQDDEIRRGVEGPPEPDDDFDFDPRELVDIVRNPRDAIRERVIERAVERVQPTRTEPPENVGPPRDLFPSTPPTNAPPQRQQAPPTTPQRSQTTTPRKPGPFSRAGVRFGTIGGGAVLFGLSRRNTANPAVLNRAGEEIAAGPVPSGPTGTGAVAGLVDPSTQAFRYYATGTSSSTSSGSCSCGPKRKGPRYKCLERAPVVYKSGRRKGKSAGTKCIRFSTTPLR